MSAEGPAAVVDTNVFGAELTRRGAPVAGAYREHVQGRALFISFVTVAELRYGARLAGWGESNLDQGPMLQMWPCPLICLTTSPVV